MIEWVMDNKEWLFSGIGVTVLLGILYLIRKTVRRPQHSAPQVAGQQQQVLPSHSQPQQKKLVELDVKKIIEEIGLLPPYQRNATRKHYIGVRFRFAGTLFSAKAEDGDTIRIVLRSLNKSQSPLIFASAIAKDNPQLKFIHEGTKVTIEGDLKEFDSHTATLENIDVLAYE